MSKFSDATLYLAPSGYKEGILFPQKPLSTNGEISFTRASSAWRTNIEGQVEEVCYNLFQQSEDFSNAAWGKEQLSVTSNSTTAPDNTTNADTWVENTANSVHRVSYYFSSVVSGNSYTMSLYLKNNGRRFFYINCRNSFNAGSTFDLQSGVVSTVGIGTASIENVGNGWYRCSVTGTCTISGVYNMYYQLNNSGVATDTTYTGDGVSGVFIWGAQLVQGGLPRPYLSTTNRQNFPRVDYSLGTGTFLLEPQRTNIHLNSNSMYNMSAFGSTLPIVTQATTFLDPLASYNAALVTGGSGSSGSWGIFTTIPTVVTSGQIVVASCYVKAGTHDKIMLQHANVTITGAIQAYFDLATVTTPTAGASIQAVGNGWYRCVMQPVTFTVNSNPTSYNIGCYVTPSTSTNTWSSDFTGKSVYFYGIQVEVGSYVTSLIPTTSLAVTRIADSFSRGNIFTNNLISSSGGTWFVELKNNVAYTRDAGNQNLWIGDLSTAPSNSFEIRNGGGTNVLLTIGKRISNTFTVLYTTTTSTTKIAIKWNGTSCDVFVNGTKQVSASAFTITVMEFLAAKTEDVPKFIQQMALWRTPLTDAECISLTL